MLHAHRLSRSFHLAVVYLHHDTSLEFHTSRPQFRKQSLPVEHQQVSFRAHLGRRNHLHPHIKRNGLFLVRSKVHHYGILGVGRNILTFVLRTSFLKRNRRHRIRQVQLTAIVLHASLFSGIIKLDFQIANRQMGAERMRRSHQFAAGNPVPFYQFARKKQLPQTVQPCPPERLLLIRVIFPGPHAGLVQCHRLLVHTAKDHGSHPAITNREGFHPFIRRSIVP